MKQQEIVSKCPMANIEDYSKKNIVYIRNILKEKYGKKRPLRIFHAKSIGLVEAQFIINGDLDPYLKVGLFKNATTYQAWIRFSNSGSTPGPDFEKGLRGMAIKVMDVQSEQFIDEDIEGKTQDFILINSRSFVPGTGALALDGVKVILGKLWEKVTSFLHVITVSPIGVIPFLKGVAQSPNILEEVYHSATPYAFGDGKAIKWRAMPLKTITSTMPNDPDNDFLRERLIEDLSDKNSEEIAFELSIQFQENKETEPIDNSGVIWKTKFKPVATIKIPKQNLNTEERLCKDARMSFSPGHAMIEHQPLGSVNMVRRKVYETLAKERLAHG
jgi:hypothetical protein